MPRISRVDDYIAGRAEFAKPILAWLRERVHAVSPEIEEAIKWSHPFFTYKDRPLAHMAAFKEHASFGFWNRQSTTTGREGEAMGQYGRITSVADLPPAEEIEAQVRAAILRSDAGEKPARSSRAASYDVEIPAALAEALAVDSQAAATFQAFPPSCRREYCEWIADAKRPETRAKRVAEAVSWLSEGKRRNWKYESC
jgi:uncharacterized protein YdeI (YjbR/CyaY-like superfamily)